MRTKLVVGNWKMNMTATEAAAAVQTFVTSKNTFVGSASVAAGGAVGTFTGTPGGCTLP